jgi:hypothetical protein
MCGGFCGSARNFGFVFLRVGLAKDFNLERQIGKTVSTARTVKNKAIRRRLSSDWH